MDQLIHFLISVLVFAMGATGLYFICVKFELPKWAYWICGGLLIIVALLFLATELGVAGGTPLFPPVRR